ANHKTDAKKIAWVHTDLEKHRSMPIEKEREVYRKFDKIVCVSNASKQSVLNLYPEYKDKVEVIYNPIDKEEIIIKSKEQVEDIRNNKITLVTAGRLTKVKGYDILLEAHSQLLKEGLDYNLVILGEGELKAEFECFIQKKSIGKNTKLLGFKSNPYPYIKQGDIFVMSSRYEGYPLVLCEALTLGKPIIATDCTGATEILDDGKYGILAPIEDISALKNAMREMIQKEELREKYSQLAVERSSIFNIEDVMKQIEELLDEK
ncbi:MAG: glycosyltransferase, partial [Cetobacterium sp.]